MLVIIDVDKYGSGRHISSFHTFCYVKANYFRRSNFIDVKNGYNERERTSKIIISHIH